MSSSTRSLADPTMGLDALASNFPDSPPSLSSASHPGKTSLYYPQTPRTARHTDVLFGSSNAPTTQSTPKPVIRPSHLNVSPTPPSKRKNLRSFSDRYISQRDTSTDLAGLYELHESSVERRSNKRKASPDEVKSEESRLYGVVIRNELCLGEKVYDMTPGRTHQSRRFFHSTNLTNPKTLFASAADRMDSPIYNLSPISQATQKVLICPKKPQRQLSRVPYKVLDAPDLQDDFYLNLVDWSSTNLLGVGLGSCVYLWSALTGKVTKLCDLGPTDSVTSVNWMQRGTHVAVGTNEGLVQIWDVLKQKKLRTMTGHTGRVGNLAWNESTLTSGSRDRNIYHRDVRAASHYYAKLTGHKQEICGLKWNVQENLLASGGNDNKLYVWDKHGTTPVIRYEQHTAAVKAISWSPHQRGLLASGGGTADKHIRFWNTMTGSANPVSSHDTGSQVCNLAWSKNGNELVSTHGYSQNQVVVWKYGSQSLSQVATLTGHQLRVLYLAMSPDGETIVTGAGDETLRFWTVFPKSEVEKPRPSSLSLASSIR